MLQLQIILVIFSILTIVSAVPIINLKYHSDLYDYMDQFNEYCLHNKEDDMQNLLPEKDTYMWKISNYLYDHSKEIIRGDNPFSANVYKQYFEHALGTFLIMVIFIITYIVLSFYGNYFAEDYYQPSQLVLICIILVVLIVCFSIILKKITEIYNDTYVYHYTKFMQNVNYLLSNLNAIVKVDEPPGGTKRDIGKLDKSEIDDLQKYGNDVGNIIFNSDVLNNFVKPYRYKIIENSFKFESQKVESSNSEIWEQYTYQNVDMYPIYHSKEQKDKIKYKINEVVSYLFAYLVLLLALFFLFARTFNDYFVYVYIVIVLVIAIASYSVYTALR